MNATEVFRIIERLVTLLYLPIIGWMLVTVLENREHLLTINANRFTASDGYEVTIQMNAAVNTLRNSVNLLEQETIVMERRLRALEDARNVP